MKTNINTKILITSLLVLVAACSPKLPRELPLVGGCKQPRFTEQAPTQFYAMSNPFTGNRESIEAGKRLFLDSAQPVPCAKCHGKKGDGLGPMANMFDPPPRDFTCPEVVSGIPDGQLYWIIKNGSPETSMPAFKELDDEQVWQLVAYIRQLVQ